MEYLKNMCYDVILCNHMLAADQITNAFHK
jgi:hypothetical protein